ncbi:MAG: SynChlorMet cassette radical SAM/SPASM protein ScmF [bacterium]
MENKHKLNCLYFYLTEGCNLACRHCWITPKFQAGGEHYPTLSLGLFRSIIEQAKPLGLSKVKLTGGEPLLHPEIRELLDHIKEQDLALTVETNGVLITAELARQMKSCKSPFVSVSIDGADAKTHEWVRGVPGSFEKAWAGIYHLVAAGFKPQIIFSIMKGNKEQLESLVKLAEEAGAGSVKINIVQPTARGEKMHEAGETLDITELIEIGKWVEEELSTKTKIKLMYSHPMAFRPLSRIYGANGTGCGICGIFGLLGVLASGKYALCGIGENIPELIFGDAAIDKLADVWANDPVLNQIRNGLPDKLEGVCGNCLLKGRCLGSCIAQNYYRNKNLFAPFWYCEEAAKKGLLPKTRLL